MKKPMKEEAISAGSDRMVVMLLTSSARVPAVKPQMAEIGERATWLSNWKLTFSGLFAVPGPILRRRACANGKNATCLK